MFLGIQKGSRGVLWICRDVPVDFEVEHSSGRTGFRGFHESFRGLNWFDEPGDFRGVLAHHGA